MARSRWKLKYFSNSIWRKIFFFKFRRILKRRNVFRDRSSVIPNCFSLYGIRIHKGKYSRRYFLSKFVVGRKFGEFSYTRKPFHFPLRKMKKRKNLMIRR